MNHLSREENEGRVFRYQFDHLLIGTREFWQGYTDFCRKFISQNILLIIAFSLPELHGQMLNTHIDVLLKILMLSCKHVENHTYSSREILLSPVNKSSSNRFSFFLMALLLLEISHYVICVYTENSLIVRCLRFQYGTTACCARRYDSTLLIGRNSSALWLTVVEGVFLYRTPGCLHLYSSE